MNGRDQLDAIAWQTIKSPKVYPPSQTKWRPRDYVEIGEQLRAGREFEFAWGDFLQRQERGLKRLERRIDKDVVEGPSPHGSVD